jgi:hypothetical protein
VLHCSPAEPLSKRPEQKPSRMCLLKGEIALTAEGGY